MDNSRKNKTIAKNTIFLYFRQILTMGVSLYTSRIILQVLGVVDYGVYNVVGGMVAMFAFLNSSLAQATQRFIASGIEKDDTIKQRETFSMLMNVHIIIAIILFLLCETVGLWLFYNKLVIPAEKIDDAFWVMQCSIATLMITVTQVPYNASIFGHEHMNTYAYVSILEVLLKLIIVIVLQFYFNDKLLAYGILVMCVQFIIAMTYRLYCLHKFPNCSYKFYWSKALFMQIFKFSGWSLIGNLAFTLNSQGMNFLINIFFGPVYNAAKGIATAVESAVSSFVTNFLAASIPQIIKSYASGNLDYCFKLNFKSSKFGFFLFMLISLPLISIITPVLSIWLDKIPERTSIFCVLSLLYIQANTMGGTLQNVVHASGNIKKFQLTNGILKLLPLPFVYILYKCGADINSYLYILISTSIVGLFVQLIAIHYTIHEYNIIAFLKNVTYIELKTFVIPGILSYVCYSVIKHTFITSILTFFGILSITAFSIWGLGLNKSEKEWIKSIVYTRLRIKK